MVLHIKVTGSIPVWSKIHVAEMAIAAALKVVTYTVYGFESHHVLKNFLIKTDNIIGNVLDCKSKDKGSIPFPY